MPKPLRARAYDRLSGALIQNRRPWIIRRVIVIVISSTGSASRARTVQATRAIEDACGVSPRVYRAPSYSITRRSLWAFEILLECGFTHDSSVYPISHDRYGIPGFDRHAQTIETPSGTILEVPIATARTFGGRLAPVGGGGYLRLFPYSYTAAGLRRINTDERRPACVYLHPWEIDPEQPRLADGAIARLRTYTGLKTMAVKLDRLLTQFSFSTLTAVHPARLAIERITAPARSQVATS